MIELFNSVYTKLSFVNSWLL